MPLLAISELLLEFIDPPEDSVVVLSIQARLTQDELTRPLGERGCCDENALVDVSCIVGEGTQQRSEGVQLDFVPIRVVFALKVKGQRDTIDLMTGDHVFAAVS